MTLNKTVSENPEVTACELMLAELVMTCLNKYRRNQQAGAALMLLVFILAIAMTTYLLKSLNSEDLKVERANKTSQSLNAAKQALIAWAVSNSDNLGQMPYPDRAGGGGYDGQSDCLPSFVAFNYAFLIGQLPIFGQTAPCVAPQVGLGTNSQDAKGNRFWYAVSRNLVHKYDAPASDPVINPSIINTPTWPWLRVLDRNGVLISDRVAAVIIAPGDAIGNQSRSNTAAVNNYLDSFQVGGNAFSNRDYDAPDEDFFLGADMSSIDANDPGFARPYLFNDQLVYITIDELMAALEIRVAQEAAFHLTQYYQASAINAAGRFYPYAAVNNDVENTCEEGSLAGRLPIDRTPAIPSNCMHANPGLSTLPIWFDTNRWQDFTYYALSADCTFATPGCALVAGISVGAQANINALIISTGEPIAGQLVSNDVSVYLDGIENTNGDATYDAVGTPLTSNYNDQMFIVSP